MVKKIEKIPMCFVSTTWPEIPVSLSIFCNMKFEDDKIICLLERSGSIAGDEKKEMTIDKNDIIRAEATLYRDLSGEELDFLKDRAILSSLELFVKDPAGIVDSFTHRFESHKSYWIKAAIKSLKEMNIPVTISEIPTTE